MRTTNELSITLGVAIAIWLFVAFLTLGPFHDAAAGWLNLPK